MKERSDEQIDHELAGLAMAALSEHERLVTTRDVEAALASVRARIDAGDVGGEVLASRADVDHGRPRSWWALAGAAAAVVALLGVGLMVVVGGDDEQLVAPVALPPGEPEPTSLPDSEAPSASVPPGREPAPTEPTLVADVATTDLPESESESDPTTVPATPNPSVVTPPATTDAPQTTVEASSSGELGFAIPRACTDDSQCTSLAAAADGRIVAFDPVRSAVEVYDPAGRNLLSEQPIGAALEVDGAADNVFLEAIGPDDVAYLTYSPERSVDPIRELVAVPLKGPNSGTIVNRWAGLDGTGGSTLVPSPAGLVEVPCCGAPSGRVPSPERTVFEWVDRDGSSTESTAPSIQLRLGDAGNELTRVDGVERTSFQLPSAFQTGRDFPDVVATDDGGALASQTVALATGTYEVLVDFDVDWPTGRADNGDVYWRRGVEDASFALLEPAGSVIAVEDGAFVRRELGEVATQGWPEVGETSLDAAATTAPGLNEFISERQPFWAAQADTFAHQIVQTLGANETITFDFDDSPAPTITVTTAGFLDDSVESAQRVITTERGEDGLLRFVSSTYGFRCQPGRGHQDYSTELCL
ncbi:MAG: hypothetical protein AB8G26_02220 [Ilumatobacter sp.]